MRHYLVTRHAQNNPSREYFEERQALFTQYYLSSLAGQTNKNFTVVLLVDDGIPDDLRERLNETIGRYDLEVVITDALWKIVSEPSITTRLDNDDAVSIDFIDDIQLAAKDIRREDKYVINFSEGYIESEGRFYEYSAASNMFITIVGHTTPYVGEHTQLQFKFPHYNISGQRRWIHVQHPGALTHRFGNNKIFEKAPVDIDFPRFAIVPGATTAADVAVSQQASDSVDGASASRILLSRARGWFDDRIRREERKPPHRWPNNDAIAQRIAAVEKSFAEQLERRNAILRDVGLVTDINDRKIEYPLFDAVRTQLLMRPELAAKIQQGFDRVQPIPFGAPLEMYFAALNAALRKYAQDGRLRTPHGTKLTLDAEQPIRKWSEYEVADRTGALVYEPMQFMIREHGGKTKAQVVAERGSMQVILTESFMSIPRAEEGKTVSGRPQIEAGKSAGKYLSMLGTPPYDLETGYTLEAELAHILTHLHETQGEVLEDYCSGRAAWCPGSWLPARGVVPNVYFFPGNSYLHVDGGQPTDPRSMCGVRCAVRVA